MTENLPHIVYPKGLLEGEVRLFQCFKDAKFYWDKESNYKNPLYIRPCHPRWIDPAEHITGVAE